MAWWIKTEEIANVAGQGIGRYRLTATSDEDGGGPHPLCDCEGGHPTRASAKFCRQAKERKRAYG